MNRPQAQLVTYLTDVHALEQNALATLKTATDLVDNAALRQAIQEHLGETEEHERLIGERLKAYDKTPSALKDIAQKGGALLSGALAKLAPDTSAKLLAQAYAFEHLEIASYRMLRVAAERATDPDTVKVAEHILLQEEQAAEKLESLIEQVAADDLQRHLSHAA
jgi:ferritin-like metal-binding protein YciE